MLTCNPQKCKSFLCSGGKAGNQSDRINMIYMLLVTAR